MKTEDSVNGKDIVLNGIHIGEHGVKFVSIDEARLYPGNPCLLPLYNALVREMMTESSRSCDIKVIGSDRLRWSVYEGDKIYLLNTDYDMPITVKVIKGEKEQIVTLNSLELRTIEI